MGLFFVYILKSSVCLALFYLFYRLLLSKETFHRFNRLALLGLLALSCLIPLMEVTVKEPSDVSLPFLSLEEMLMMASAEGMATVEEAAPATFPWRELLLMGYLAGILFFFLRHVWSLSRMLRLIGRCRKEVLGQGIVLFTHREKVAPFSWMKAVVISETDLEESGDAILKHECAHIRNGHSWDLLLAEVCIFFQWFNPAAWLLKQELQNIHEFEADEWVISQGIDAKKYQLLLIKKAVGARLYSIANSFNHSSLKKRITMMIKKKSNPWARMKYLYVLPLAAVAVAAFARPEVSNELSEISSVKVNDLTSIMKGDEVKSVEISSEEKVKVSGIVVDADSQKPIIGAAVLIKGTTNGVVTDKEGKFELDVEIPNVLLVAYVGYATSNVSLTGERKDLRIPLHLSDGKSDIVVTAVPNGESSSEEEGPMLVVDQMPQFPGGMSECMKFIAKNMKYPAEAQKEGVQGRVIVQFVVKADGSLSDYKVVRGVHPALDAEALKVLAQMPKWQPGLSKGKPVDVKYTVPIMFGLSEKERGGTSPVQVHLKVDKNASAESVDMAKEHLKNGDTVVLRRRGPSAHEGTDKILVVVDGEVKGRGQSTLNQIKRSDIEAMSIVAKEAAIAKYGDKAKDGAIEITTKKK